jgi:hypothetical protein
MPSQLAPNEVFPVAPPYATSEVAEKPRGNGHFPEKPVPKSVHAFTDHGFSMV